MQLGPVATLVLLAVHPAASTTDVLELTGAKSFLLSGKTAVAANPLLNLRSGELDLVPKL